MQNKANRFWVFNIDKSQVAINRDLVPAVSSSSCHYYCIRRIYDDPIEIDPTEDNPTFEQTLEWLNYSAT